MARRDVVYARKSQITALSSDHGTLTGLGDDDHTQYHTDARALTWLQSQNATNLNGTAYRLLYVDSAGDLQELAHGTSGQVLTSNGASADPSWQAAGGGLSNVVEDTTPQLGGSLDVNGQKIVSVTNGDIDIEPNGTGNVLLGNFTFDADQTVGVGQDNYVLTYDNATGLISLEAAAGGSSLTNFQDNGLSGEALYNSAVVLRTVASGIDLIDDTTNPVISGYETGGSTQVGQLQFQNGTYGFTLNNTATSGLTTSLGRDSTATLTIQWQADPNGPVKLYYDGSQSFATNSVGASIIHPTADNPVLRFFQDDLTTRNGFIQYHSTSGLIIENEVHGTPITLRGEDAVGTLQSILIGDPDAAVDLYYAGIIGLKVGATSTAFYSTSDDNPYLAFYQDDTTTRNGYIHFTATSGLKVANEVHGGTVDLRSENAAGAGTILLAGDPDADLALYYAGSETARTISGGFSMDQTVLNAGAELTIATGAITVTHSYHTVDTQSNAATDDLDTINGGVTGALLVLRTAANARDVVCKDATGNLVMNVGDFTLSHVDDKIMFIYDGTNWCEISRSNNT